MNNRSDKHTSAVESSVGLKCYQTDIVFVLGSTLFMQYSGLTGTSKRFATRVLSMEEGSNDYEQRRFDQCNCITSWHF